MQPHAVHILKLAVEMTEFSGKALLEYLEFRRQIRRFLKEDVQLPGITSFLKFIIGRHQFLPGIFSKLGPIDDHAHFARLEFLVIFLLLVLRSHGAVQVFPLGEFQIQTARAEDAVQMVEQGVELQTFSLKFVR